MKREIATQLRNGHPVHLRPLRRDDRPYLVTGIESLSERSRYMRFFTSARELPAHVIDRLVDVDSRLHIAWGALDESCETPRALGAAHAIRTGDAPEAELAFGILDEVHSQGLARMLIAAVVYDCQRSGIETLHADTLSENRKAARLLRHLGGFCCEAEGGIFSFKLSVADCLNRMRTFAQPAHLKTVFQTLDAETSRNAA
ncbi:MAG: GNAT family N-acetyltransferase [Pseudomonadota bacterium]